MQWNTVNVIPISLWKLGKILNVNGGICYYTDSGYTFDAENMIGMIQGTKETPFYNDGNNELFIIIKCGSRFIIVDQFYEGGNSSKIWLLKRISN